ncbi:conserved hypothetical protein [Thiomonas sp. X19]|uniref:hypothetical protein n=1 Tax=Thiomonas sp. X19 TaxID=1050370 RepID=UPI000B742B75|nr:hypothetical protein [Thiomonas sp. X19]SCC94534.1 conserved hypothetical protein [Thiomonas sp. X19]
MISHWFITAGALLQLLAAALDKTFVMHEFDHPTTVVISPWHPPHPQIRTWEVSRAISVTSMAALRQEIHDGVPSGVNYVVLDIERWPLTPVDEQLHPAKTVREAARIAHSHGLRLIAAPATDLIWGLHPAEAKREGQFRAFIHAGLARRMAPFADWYVIQAERAEGSPVIYRQFVNAVSRQVHEISPRTVVLGEVETNHAEHRVAASLLLHDIEATCSRVDGYWLGIPQQGLYCTDCGQARPNVALSLLRGLPRSCNLPP